MLGPTTYIKPLLFLRVTRVITSDVAAASPDVTAESVHLATTTRTPHLHLDRARPRVTAAWWRMTDHSTRMTTCQLTFTYTHTG